MQQKRNIPRSTPPPTAKPARLELRPDRAFVLHLDVRAQLPRRVVGRVEHVTIFPKDSADPPSGNVPARVNSPADVEIDTATRDASLGTLAFTATLLDEDFSVLSSVVNGINKKPNSTTLGDGPATGDVVQITITFTPPIVLPADHYFFRPEVQVTGGDFVYLSAPKPIVAPGTPFTGDLQAWIRNADLKPDWLRIGTDIIGGTTRPTFNMALSLTGETTPQAESRRLPRPRDQWQLPQPRRATTTGAVANIGAAASANRGPLWLLLSPAALLWWTRRRRG